MITVLAFALLATGATANAEVANDTIVIESPDRVTISNDSCGYHITVKGRKGNPDYKYETTRSFAKDDDVEVKREVDFTVPFSRYWEDKRNGRRKTSFSPHWSGFGIGSCNVVNTKSGGLNGAEGVTVNTNKSFELFFNFTTASYDLGSGFGVFTGTGLNWRNFRMDNEYRFVKTDNKISLETYPEGAKVQFSRLKMFSITVPFMVEWQVHGYSSLFINAGPVFNINTYGSILTRYKLDGEKVKTKNKSVHQSPLTVDFMAQIGFGSFGVYMKYSPCKLIQKGYGPDMNPFTCGVMFHL